MIEFRNVCKNFGRDKKAVDNLNMTVNGGEIFGFLGPNGAGKTTTIKMLTGILKPDSGKIMVDGAAAGSLSAKQKIGYVPDSPDMLLKLTGTEYLNFMADIYEVPPQLYRERVEKLCAELEMSDALGDRLAGYSHGMRQKIVLIGALLNDPDVWILDEPMTGLDPKASYTLKQMMRAHAGAGKTVFFSTHILEVAEELCDKVAIISHGKTMFSGTVAGLKEQFKKEGSLEKIFLEITENEKIH